MDSENLIFISYAREDKDFSVNLAHDLLSQGANIWLADFEIKAGDSWDMEVQKALTACISFLVVLSEASEKSKNVMDEVAYAIEEKKVIIPILFQKCNIHFRLRRLQHVDFTVDYDHGIQDLIESVRVPQETAPQEKDKRDAKKEKEDSINSLYREAEAATANKDWSAAKEKLQAILQLQPNHSKAKAGFEQVKEQMKLVAEEKELADLYSKGKEHLDARRFQKALEFFQKIQKIKADYKDVGALSTAAEQELLHVKKPPQIKPTTPLLKKILQQRGAILIGSGFLLSLIVVTYMVFETDLLKKRPLAGDVSNDSLYVNLLQEGDALFSRSRYREAKAKFEEALALQPDDSEAANKSAASDREIRYADAITEGKKRISRGDYTGAKSYFKTALSVKANDNYASEKLKECNDKISQQKAEEERLRQFTKSKNDGETYFKQGKYAEAKQKFQAALSYKSGDFFVRGRIKECDRLLAKPKEVPRMAYIPSGSFLMGSEDDYDDEKPVHEVTVDAFYMDSTEVTVEQYRKFLSETGRQQPTNWTEQLQQPKHPVVYVSWNNAVAYAKWARKRLPTEAEWEYAARGGNTGYGGKPKYKYPWGNHASPNKANFDSDNSRDYSWENAKKYLRDVGSYAPNKYGLYDMAGNVWEWCSDWYASDYYKNSPEKNPKGGGTGTLRVLRGGSWDSDPYLIRCANRLRSNPTNRFNFNGFRCVQDAR